jgi:ketosteroid isomerase-like protein
MKRGLRTGIISLGFVLILLLAGARAMWPQGMESTHTGDEAQILALENAWNQAELHNDSAPLKLLLTDDFVITEPDGELNNKQQHMASTADKSYHYDMLVSEGFRVRVYGTVAVVTGSYHEAGTSKGKHFDRRGRFTDTWLKFGPSWQCAASHDSIAVKE